MSAPLNLASRPFRNTRLPRLLLGLAWLAVLALTGLQAVLVWRLLPTHTAPQWREARKLEAQLAAMAERDKLARSDVDKDTLKRWAALQELVDRRAFSWSRLFVVLEELAPPGVRVLSLAPHAHNGILRLEMEAEARSQAEALLLLSALEGRPEFDQVYPLSIDESPAGRRLRCTMLYQPPEEEGQ